jgi:hypothetical protein
LKNEKSPRLRGVFILLPVCRKRPETAVALFLGCFGKKASRKLAAFNVVGYASAAFSMIAAVERARALHGLIVFARHYVTSQK